MTTPPPAMNHALTLTAMSRAGSRPLALKLPSVDTPWAYAWAYGRAALASLTSAHRMRADAAVPRSAPVQISPRLANRWRALFDVPARAAALVPLLSNQSVGTLLHARLFADLGLNMRHLLHLQHRTTHHASVQACTRSREQRLDCHVRRVLRLGEDRVLVEVQTLVLDAGGQLLTQIEDGFVVDHLPPADLSGLPSDRPLLRELLGLRRRLPRLSTSEGPALVSAMPVPLGMGLAYGRVSGDMNLVHCCRLGAWMFGLKRPFLQGLALRNLVLRHLVELGAPVDGLQLTFAAPAVLGQTLMLVVEGNDFEVHDARGRLVAFGTSESAAV